MIGETTHSLYTTNDRGVNEVTLREIPHPYWFMGPLDLFIELPQLTRRGSNDLHNGRAQRTASLARNSRKYICQELLPLRFAQLNISGLSKRIIRDLPLNGLIHTQSLDVARAAHASLAWWPQRDLNPCSNHAPVFAIVSTMLDESAR